MTSIGKGSSRATGRELRLLSYGCPVRWHLRFVASFRFITGIGIGIGLDFIRWLFRHHLNFLFEWETGRGIFLNKNIYLFIYFLLMIWRESIMFNNNNVFWIENFLGFLFFWSIRKINGLICILDRIFYPIFLRIGKINISFWYYVCYLFCALKKIF